jgi:hypothetical protein
VDKWRGLEEGGEDEAWRWRRMKHRKSTGEMVRVCGRGRGYGEDGKGVGGEEGTRYVVKRVFS